MEKVYIKECDSYDKGKLKEYFKEIFSLLEINVKNKKVLIKPNLLMSKTPEFPSTINPKFIVALIEFLISNGADPMIYEIPGFNSVENLIESIGIKETCDKLDVKIRDKGELIILKREDNLIIKELPLPLELKEYDLIINLAKLKTHSLTGLTLGVKNTFGLVKQDQRVNYHFKSGRDKELFSDMIIDIHLLINPQLTILDGINGIEGNGPSNGKERKFNVIAASKNAFSLDAQVIDLLRLNYLQIPTQKRAVERNIKGAKLEEIELLGDKIEMEDPILLPDSYSKKKNRIINNAVNLAYPFLRSLMVSRPKIIKEECIKCYRCIKVCPAKTISKGKDDKPKINYENCISCFCCHEMCPEGAIAIEKNKLRRIMEKIVIKKSK